MQKYFDIWFVKYFCQIEHLDFFSGILFFSNNPVLSFYIRLIHAPVNPQINASRELASTSRSHAYTPFYGIALHRIMINPGLPVFFAASSFQFEIISSTTAISLRCSRETRSLIPEIRNGKPSLLTLFFCKNWLHFWGNKNMSRQTSQQKFWYIIRLRDCNIFKKKRHERTFALLREYLYFPHTFWSENRKDAKVHYPYVKQ